LYCGKELQKQRKLKDFCSYSHRGKHVVNALDGAEYQSGLSGSKNTKRNKALRALQKQSRGDFTFHRINSVTYRTDRPCKRGGDDYPLTYDADGHVELPACLDYSIRRSLARTG
jgi:hypothetical protein